MGILEDLQKRAQGVDVGGIVDQATQAGQGAIDTGRAAAPGILNALGLGQPQTTDEMILAAKAAPRPGERGLPVGRPGEDLGPNIDGFIKTLTASEQDHFSRLMRKQADEVRRGEKFDKDSKSSKELFEFVGRKMFPLLTAGGAPSSGMVAANLVGNSLIGRGQKEVEKMDRLGKVQIDLARRGGFGGI